MQFYSWGWQIGWQEHMMNDFDIDRQKIKALMKEAAFSLTWEPVEIEFHAPPFKSFQGRVIRNKTGRFEISLIPDLPLEKLYMSFLHEVGHICLGHCVDFLPMDSSDEYVMMSQAYGPDLVFTEKEIEEYKERPEEMQANDFANSFDGIAKEFAMRWFQTEDVEARLRALSRITISKGE